MELWAGKNKMKIERNSLRIIPFILHFTAFPIMIFGTFFLFDQQISDIFSISTQNLPYLMFPITSLMFILCGLSLIFTVMLKKFLAILTSLIVIFITGIFFIEYSSNINFYIEHIFLNYTAPFFQSLYIFSSLPANICFMLSGICIILTNFNYKQFTSFFVVIACCFISAIVTLSFFGNILEYDFIQNWYGLTSMKPLTSFCFAILSFGLFFTHSLYLFYHEKVLFGPIIGSISLWLLVTFILWNDFYSYQNFNIRKSTQKVANFITKSLEEDINLISGIINRMVIRINTLEEAEILKGITFNLYLKDLNGLTLLSYKDDDSQLKWKGPANDTLLKYQNNTNLMNIIKYVQKNNPNKPTFFVNNETSQLFIVSPSTSINNQKKILLADINLKKFIGTSINKFNFENYNINIYDDKTLIYSLSGTNNDSSNSGANNDPSNSGTNNGSSKFSASAMADFPPIYWKVTVSPIESSPESTHFQNFILLAGLFVALFVASILYLLQLLLRAKEDVSNILKEKENTLAYLQAILDSSNYSIISTDNSGAIVSFNQAAEHMLGWTSNEMINKSPEVFHDKAEVYKRALELSKELNKKIQPGFDVFSEMPKRDITEEREWTYVRKDRTTLPVLLSITAIKDSNGNYLGYVGIAQDLTKIKKLEEMKNDLIAITSHELRSPLASIKVALDLLSETENLTPQEKTLLNIAYKNCEQLQKLSTDILDTEKIEFGKMEYSLNSTHLKDLIINAIDINQILGQNNQVKLIKPIDIPDINVLCDEGRILQVMTNFISNAIKNSPKNGEIFFIITKMDHFLSIGIKDQGSGIPLKFQPLVFQKFSQDPYNANKMKGSGLGLSICKSIIEAHKGNIGFDTSEKGTTFWFELPLSI